MMRRTWIAVVTLFALLLGGPALLAQEAAQAVAPVKQVDVRSLVPEEAVFYLEVNDLPGTWQAIKKGPLYEELIQTQFGKQLRVMAAAPLAQLEVILGVSVEDAVTTMLGKRLVLAGKPGRDDAAFLVELADPDGVRGLIDAARQAEADPSGEGPFRETTHRGHTIYSNVGRPGHFAICGNVFVAGELPGVRFIIDRFEDGTTSSILTNQGFKSAVASLPAGCRAMVFLDLEKALLDAPLDEQTLEVTGAKPALERFAVKHALSLVRSLRQAAAGLYLTSSGVEVQLNVTRDPSVLTDEVRAIFAQENVTPEALAYRTEDTVLFVSLPRITAQMKLIGQAVELALPQLMPPPEGSVEMRPIRPLDLILGHNFTEEVLPGIGPEISLLVDVAPLDPELLEDAPLDPELPENAPRDGGTPVKVRVVNVLLAESLRAGLFVQLSDEIRPSVERLVQTALGLLMTVGQDGFRLSQIQVGDATGYTAEIRMARPAIIGKLLRPTLVFTDDLLVVASHPELVQRALARRSGSEAVAAPAEDLAGHIVAFVNLDRILKGVEATLQKMAARQGAAGPGEQAQAPEAGQVLPPRMAMMLEVLRPLAGQVSLVVRHTPAQTDARLKFLTATPLLR